ncbi:MAG: 2-C-methyl-D-erythritol 2,4-cyclodiphosphate synthase [Spirochaetota bacterium]
MYRIGQGIDFHKLQVDPSRPLILGGYTIESDLALIGHSDADILLHALADAILGALALGDIGYHFPDTDPANKGLDSSKILAKTLELMQVESYAIVNLDATIICEKPKINPHRDDIRKSLSTLLAIPLKDISIKATTVEKMGAIGRKEGVAVQVVALLQKLP